MEEEAKHMRSGDEIADELNRPTGRKAEIMLKEVFKELKGRVTSEGPHDIET